MYGPSDSYYEFDPHYFEDEYDEDGEVCDDYTEDPYEDFEHDHEAEWGGEDKSDWWMAGA